MSRRREAAPYGRAELFGTVSPLRLWWTWLGSLAAIVAILTICFIIAFSGIDKFGIVRQVLNMGMYVIILAPGLLAIFYSYKEASFIAYETQIASRQVGELTRASDVEEFLSVAEPSVFKNHIDSLHRIFQASPDISQDNLIEILHARLMSKNSLIEVSASMLITLGLIGTIVGLIIMANSLGNTLQTAGTLPTTELMQRIAGPGGPLSGLGVAFYTTLFGAVLGGVLLRVLTVIVDTAVTDYTAHIAELTEVNVLPFMKQLAKALDASGYYASRITGSET